MTVTESLVSSAEWLFPQLYATATDMFWELTLLQKRRVLLQAMYQLNIGIAAVFGPTDDIKTKMSGWYTEGTEVVFACGGGIYLSATAAAEEAGKKVIGVDVDQSAESATIITSAMKELTLSVKISLESLYKNKGKWNADYAGKTAVLGAVEKCVGLPTAQGSWNFRLDRSRIPGIVCEARKRYNRGVQFKRSKG